MPEIEREYIHWESFTLRRRMEALVFGHSGRPVLVFPTSMGRFYQYEDFGMVAALAERIHAGELQLFCVDGVDDESWYNRSVPPHKRGLRHIEYENYVLGEFLPYMRTRNSDVDDLVATGCSFGAYHAINLAFRHPGIVKRVVALGGKYEVRHLMGGFYDDNVYFNSPIDFMPGLADAAQLELFRRHLEIVLVTGEMDICRDSTEELSRILRDKRIPHVLDVWCDGTGHDWPWWRQMILKHI